MNKQISLKALHQCFLVSSDLLEKFQSNKKQSINDQLKLLNKMWTDSSDFVTNLQRVMTQWLTNQHECVCQMIIALNLPQI